MLGWQTLYGLQHQPLRASQIQVGLLVLATKLLLGSSLPQHVFCPGSRLVSAPATILPASLDLELLFDQVHPISVLS